MIGVDVFNYGHHFASDEVHGPAAPCACPDGSMHPDCCASLPPEDQPDLDQDGVPDIYDSNPNSPSVNVPSTVPDTDIKFGSKYSRHSGILMGGTMPDGNYSIVYEIRNADGIICDRLDSYRTPAEGYTIHQQMIEIATRMQDTPKEKCEALKNAAKGNGITSPVRDFTPTPCDEGFELDEGDVPCAQNNSTSGGGSNTGNGNGSGNGGNSNTTTCADLNREENADGTCGSCSEGFSFNSTTQLCESDGISEENKKLLIYGFLGLLAVAGVSVVG